MKDNSSNQKVLMEAVEDALKHEGVSTEEITKFLALPKALDGGKKIRGMKELQNLLETAIIDTTDAVEEVLRQIMDSGAISREAIPQSLAFQKAISASGAGAEALAKAVLLQKAMQDSGMAINDIANAVTLAMGLVSSDEAEKLKELKEILKECIVRGLSPSDIDVVLAFKDALDKNEMPKEAIS
jgi:hypothetical protein